MAIMDAVDHLNSEQTERSARWNIDTWGAKLSGMELFDEGNVHPHYAAT